METIFTNIKERVLQITDYKGVSKERFFENLGVTYGNFKGKAKEKALSSDILAKIVSSNPDINPEWLLTGHGKMLKVETVKNEAKNLIPLYDGIVTAGMHDTAILEPTTEPVEMVDAGDWFRDATAAMRVHGDSMYPEYKSGSIVALKEVNNKRLVVYGQDYLIETSEYRVIKRLQKSDLPQNWLACSVNEEKYQSTGKLIHEPFDVHIDDVDRLFQVLGNVRRNQSSRIVYNSH